ncbi:carboxypeptidase regulatory-like domain-containing protein [Candidatus Marifrigoribacter sp. Uisw_064]|uniref:TonB-dependent receptor n=1 Tax=Candidatus Marifrigoribacter sp. Uisw_064 TaxID=3230970 RepID=UPI003D3C1B85
MKIFKNLLCAALFIFSITSASGQVTTSSIRGVVVDTNNEPFSGANIVAVHTPSGTKYGSITNFDGRYNLLNMRVGGPYSFTVSYLGYKSQTFDNIQLTLGKTYNLDVTMSEDSEELEAVVITATRDPGTFGTDRTGAETNVGRRELTRLPSISRSAADFTRLDPSASNGSFGGRNDQFNNFSLDGAIFTNPFGLDAATPGGQTDAQPVSLDAIDQIQISTAPYDVRQSGFTGAAVNAVTKSGTNNFHGTFYGFYRNEDFTGSKVKGDDVFVPKLSQTQFGASFGGPIVKNKLFFFANFEKDDREDLGQSWLPNRGTGDISESRVSESDLIMVRDALLGVGYDPGAYEGFTHETKSTKGIFKLDWNINDNNQLAIIYNFLDASKDKPAHPTALGFRGPSASTLQFQNAGYQINNKLQSIQMELNSSLEGNVSNKFQMGYTHFNDFRNPFSTPAPSITITKDGSNYIIAGHEPFSINNQLDQKVFQMSDNLSFFQGNHTYTVGVSYEKFEFDNSFNLGVYGAQGVFFPTSSIEEFQGLADSGALQGMFDDAMSSHASISSQDGWAMAETNVGQLAFYTQDEWNVSDIFKLTYGIRFDKPLYFDTSNKAQNVIDNACCNVPTIPYVNPNTGETVFIDNTKMPTNQWLISPRVGFNYDVKGNSTLQIRGGTGVFTGRLPFVWIGNQIANPEVFFLNAVDPDFKFPQVWRTNIGTDYKFENGLILTGDVSYTKDINGAHVQNWGLLPPSGTLGGVDNRPIYTSDDIINNAYVFTNSDKGRIWNASIKAQKTFGEGYYTMLAYNYLNSKDVNSIEAEITGDAFAFNAALGNVNNDQLSYSKYGNTHRIIGVASKQWKYGNGSWASTISTFFEYARGGRFNYTYGGDINGDGSNLNDLLYIPTAGEISQMQFSGEGQADAFNTYIEQDDYLSDRRGQYAERYGAIAPWRGKWDLKFLQDYNFKVSENKTHTIQFSIDILNVGNLISSEWGLTQQPNNVQPIGVAVDAETSSPIYTFDPNLTETFGYDSTLLSRWQMQFGLRYIF